MTENKYRWHDLRKNPDDLPNGYTQVEIVRLVNGIKTYEYCEYGFIEGYGYFFMFVNQDEVIGWREFEPFEVEDD